METFLLYIGKAALAAAAFYLVYLALFQHQKHFTFNRIYLPVSLAISFLIPLITFTSVRTIEATPVSYNGYVYLAESSLPPVAEPAFQWQWYHSLISIYIVGSVGFLLYLILGHVHAISIIRESRLQQLFNIKVNVTFHDVHPFSFFNKIVLSEKTLKNPDLGMIVQHESIHVRGKHTLDILFAEILFLFQWFNSFAWLLKDAIKNNLEYLTDHELTQTNDAQLYQLAMVGLAHKQGVAPFLTALNGSQLKNRIIMMKKKTENKYALLKQLVVLLLLAVLVMGLSNKEVKTEIVPAKTKMNIVVDGKTLSKDDPVLKNVDLTKNIDGREIMQALGIEDKVISNGMNISEDDDLSVYYIHTSDYIPGTNLEFDQLISGSEGKSDKKEVAKTLNAINGKIITNKQARDLIENVFKVTGKITDQNGNPLVGAAIIVKEKTVGTITDTHGDYELKLDNGNETLVYSMVGHQTIERKVGDDTKIDVQLKADDQPKTGGVQIRKSDSNVNQSGNGIAVRISSPLENEPLYVVDGIPVQDISNIDPENIQKINVVKGTQAAAIYGSEGTEKGVIEITTKKTKVLENAQPLYVVDGEVVKNVDFLDPEKIESISVLKDNPATELYGERGKNGVVMVTTKAMSELKKADPLILVDGEKTEKNIDDFDPDEIESVSVFKGEEATKKYGDEGKNGVIEIQTKDDKITTDLELLKFIAKNMKYPMIAIDNNTEGTVKLFVEFNTDGSVANILKEVKSATNIINMDEVVVVAYGKNRVTEAFDKSSSLDALEREATRVIEKFPLVDIPKFKGKMVEVNIKFVLQEPEK